MWDPAHDHLARNRSLQTAELVSRPVFPVRQARFFNPVFQPGPGFEIGPAEGRPGDAAGRIGPDPAEVFEMRPQAGGIDSDIHDSGLRRVGSENYRARRRLEQSNHIAHGPVQADDRRPGDDRKSNR